MEAYFIIRNKRVLENCLAWVSKLDQHKVWNVDISEFKSKRSIAQNKLYWSWMGILGKEIGATKDDMHREFSIRFLGPELFVVDGKQYVGAKSTTKLNVEEFTEFLTKVNATALTLGITLPTPEYHGVDR